jgi:hypothetical protein
VRSDVTTDVAPIMMTAEKAAACHHCHVLLRSDHITPAQYVANTATPVTHCVLASSPPPMLLSDSWPRRTPYAPRSAAWVRSTHVLLPALYLLAHAEFTLPRVVFDPSKHMTCCPRAECAASLVDALLSEQRVAGSRTRFRVSCAQCHTPLAACDNCAELVALAPPEAPPDASYYRCATLTRSVSNATTLAHASHALLVWWTGERRRWFCPDEPRGGWVRTVGGWAAVR